MDFRETRYKVLRSETMANIFYTDTEGWLMPRGASKWGEINAASPIFWGWTGAVGGTAACRIGGQFLGAMVDSTLVGTGAATAFGPVTFPDLPLQIGSVSLWAKIAGNMYRWHDNDGGLGTFTALAIEIGRAHV